jgi:hypothetical protein
MMPSAPALKPQPEEAQGIRLILQAVSEIRHGSVQIVIQVSKVVQTYSVPLITGWSQMHLGVLMRADAS